jgi:hypothetical protein
LITTLTLEKITVFSLIISLINRRKIVKICKKIRRKMVKIAENSDNNIGHKFDGVTGTAMSSSSSMDIAFRMAAPSDDVI